MDNVGQEIFLFVCKFSCGVFQRIAQRKHFEFSLQCFVMEKCIMNWMERITSISSALHKEFKTIMNSHLDIFKFEKMALSKIEGLENTLLNLLGYWGIKLSLVVDIAELCISCHWLNQLRKASQQQLMQNSAPSTTRLALLCCRQGNRTVLFQ